MRGPLLTSTLHEQLSAARRAGAARALVSLDLGRTQATVDIGPEHWSHAGRSLPYLATCRERTVYSWNGDEWQAVSRFGTGLVKLVPTPWGPPTFEIDGIKMLPTEQVSPYEDARAKVALVEPAGKKILDCCAGLGYFAAWCLQAGAAEVVSFEKNPDVLWLRELNPWSPEPDARLRLHAADVVQAIGSFADASFDAVLHDPPRFGTAGELYSQGFYDQLARVVRPGGRLFHYTGTPNRLTSGRDVPAEVAVRLGRAGFLTKPWGDGIVAVRQRQSRVGPF
jgi:predicted methyltransferase